MNRDRLKRALARLDNSTHPLTMSALFYQTPVIQSSELSPEDQERFDALNKIGEDIPVG